MAAPTLKIVPISVIARIGGKAEIRPIGRALQPGIHVAEAQDQALVWKLQAAFWTGLLAGFLWVAPAYFLPKPVLFKVGG